jgi:hypothetical protein
VRELREQAVRRYLPMVGIVAMAIALVFTLSRGGLVNLVAALLALLAMLRAVGRLRRSLVVTACLLVVVLAYGGWIGFGPCWPRLSHRARGNRLPSRPVRGLAAAAARVPSARRRARRLS